MTFAILLTLALIAAVLTAIPICRYEAWWVRGLDFPRLQLTVILVALALAEFVLLDLSRPAAAAIFVLTLACLAYQAWWILPYTRLFPKEVASASDHDPAHTITLMNANVLGTNRNAPALLALVREHNPDILVTLESNEWWQAQLDVLEANYPFTLKCPLDNLYGMHVYSRLALEDGQIEYLIEPGVPSMHALVRLRSGHGIRAHFLHPAPPSPTQNEESSERDAELVIVARSVAGDECPAIVSGDLNDVAWSVTTRLFRKLSGLLDPRVGRGMFNTFHAEHWFLRWPLDHLFHSHHFRLRHMRRLPAFGSDHFPILAELVFYPDSRNEHQGLEHDADDQALADTKVEEQDVDQHDVPKPGRG